MDMHGTKDKPSGHLQQLNQASLVWTTRSTRSPVQFPSFVLYTFHCWGPPPDATLSQDLIITLCEITAG